MKKNLLSALILPVFLCFTGLSLLHAQTKKPLPKGLLWEISGPGLPKKGFLYGTMHVSEKLVFNLSDSFFLALHYADQVALETNHDEWQQFTQNLLRENISSLYDANLGFGNYRRPPSLYKQLFYFPEAEKGTLTGLLSSKPILTNEFLYRTNGFRDDFEEDTYLDLFIFQAGKKLGKRVIGLETLEGSYGAVLRAQMPDIESDDNRNRNYAEVPSLEDAYRNQDLNLIDSVNHLMGAGKNYLHWMLDVRNDIMTQGIDSILKSGQSIFAAVGAAHLPGEKGIIQLLTQRGYTLRPVTFTDAAGSSDKDAIDRIRYPVQMQRQWLSDSLWSMETPGPFYTSERSDDIREQVYADMSNGAYYAVYRLPHHNWWTGQTAAYQASRIDSLIYENIPGKIFERRSLQSPFPGHDIATRTRRGDVLRYRILIAPQEIIVFSTGGNGDYANGPEADRFFNSIRFENNHNASKKAELMGFEADFPVPAQAYEISEVQRLMCGVHPKNGDTYFVYRASYHDWEYIEEDTFELNTIGERLMQPLEAKNQRQDLLSEGPNPDQLLTFRSGKNGRWYQLRLVINGPQYFMVGVHSKDSLPENPFLKKFRIRAPKYQQDFVAQEDTTLKYRVKTFAEADYPGKAAVLRLRALVETLQTEMMARQMEEYDNDRFDNQPKLSRKAFKVPESGEWVQAEFIHFESPNEIFPNDDSLRRFILEGVSNSGYLQILQQDLSISNGKARGFFLRADTNSTRAIRTHIWISPNWIYRISATVHRSHSTGAFTDQFFESFEPLEDGSPVKEAEKIGADLVRQLYETDSLTRARTVRMLQQYKPENLNDRQLDFLVQAASDRRFARQTFALKTTLLNLLACPGNNRALPFLKNVLENDSLRYQAYTAMKLAEMKNKAAYTLLFNWLEAQPRYLGQYNANLFDALKDTLELSAQYLPQIARLAQEQEYQYNWKYLLLNFVSKNLSDIKAYRQLKPGLLYTATFEALKNQYNEEEKNGTRFSNEDREYVALRNHLLLLSPFVKKDKQVRTLMDGLMKNGSKSVKMTLFDIYLKRNLPFPDSFLYAYAHREQTRFSVYDVLRRNNRLAPYEAWFQDTGSLIRSYLYFYSKRMYQLRRIDTVYLYDRTSVSQNKRWVDTYYFVVMGRQSGQEKTLVEVQVPRNSADWEITESSEQYYQMDAFDHVGGYDFKVQVKNNLAEKDWPEYIRSKSGASRYFMRNRYDLDNRDMEYIPFNFDD